MSQSLSDILNGQNRFVNNSLGVAASSITDSENFLEKNKDILTIVAGALLISVMGKINSNPKNSLLFAAMAFGICYNMTKNSQKSAICAIVTFLAIYIGNPYLSNFFGMKQESDAESDDDVMDNLPVKAYNSGARVGAPVQENFYVSPEKYEPVQQPPLPPPTENLPNLPPVERAPEMPPQPPTQVLNIPPNSQENAPQQPLPTSMPETSEPVTSQGGDGPLGFDFGASMGNNTGAGGFASLDEAFGVQPNL